MSADADRLEHLAALRDGVLAEMAEADLEYSRLRMQVERMESDQRIGRPAAAEYAEAKGRLLPAAEGRVLELFRDLLKLEDKINAGRAARGA